MTTPWKTWIRERLPSTTRTCTLTVSPGRKSGMSSRNESASSASRVFISAVLSLRWLVLGADSGTPRLSGPGELRLPCGRSIGGADGLQQLSTVPHVQDSMRGGPEEGPATSAESSSASSGGTNVSSEAVISATLHHRCGWSSYASSSVCPLASTSWTTPLSAKYVS